MTEHRYTAVAALVCDDVRNEVSGKEILIGVFADNVFVGVLPANLIVSLYLRVRFGRSDLSPVKFRVLAPSGIQVTPEASLSLPAPPDLDTVTAVVIRGINFQAQAEGRYEFQWQPPGQEWEVVTSVRIKTGTMPPLSVSQTPVSIAARPQPEQSLPGAPASS
jgi:hypothetical protein